MHKILVSVGEKKTHRNHKGMARRGVNSGLIHRFTNHEAHHWLMALAKRRATKIRSKPSEAADLGRFFSEFR